MVQKKVNYTETGVGYLPNDKPVVYKILTGAGENNYTGVAKRGRVQDRLGEHLPGRKDYIPGAKIQIEQKQSILEAEAKEQRIISRSQPRYNEQSK